MIDANDGFLPLLGRRVQENPASLFAHYEGAPLTFGELDRMATSLAVWMRGSGLKPGDAIALMIRNGPLALTLLFAIAKARAVWVPINVQSRGENLGYIVDHSAPKLIIADAELQATIEASGANLAGAQVISVEALQEIAARTNASEWRETSPAAAETFAVMFTSGTTGRPKGVLVSHRMLRLSGEAVALVSAVQPGNVMFMWEPLYHIGGAQMIVLPLICDVTLAMRRNPHSFSRRHPADLAQAAALHARPHARRAHRLGRRLPA